MTDWTGAVCAQTDAETWFPEKGGDPSPAIALCGTCPVQAACLEYAMAHSELVGVWGGTTARMRQRYRQKASQRPPLKSHAARGAVGAAVRVARSQDRAAQAVELHGQGYAAEHVAAVVGVTVDSVRRYVREAARRDAA